jgi:hypothetical protein
MTILAWRIYRKGRTRIAYLNNINLLCENTSAMKDKAENVFIPLEELAYKLMDFL